LHLIDENEGIMHVVGGVFGDRYTYF